MILTYGQIHDARRGLTIILGAQKRNIPTIPKFKLARMHDVLDPLFNPLEEFRIGLIHKYGEEQFADEAKTVSVGWQLGQNTDKYKEFEKEWEEFRAQTQEVSVTPIPLASFGDVSDGLDVAEFKLLGPLVTE